MVEGETVDKIYGLDGVRAEPAMVRTPDRTGEVELVNDLAPADDEGLCPRPANRLRFRHICVELDEFDAIVDRLRDQGLDTVGEVQDDGNIHRPCSVRGPERPIVEVAEQIALQGASWVAVRLLDVRICRRRGPKSRTFSRPGIHGRYRRSGRQAQSPVSST